MSHPLVTLRDSACFVELLEAMWTFYGKRRDCVRVT